MSAALARAVMALATRSLGARGRTWALAMQGELEVAIEEGRPLSFALGCLLAAWRALPAEREGRFVLAAHAVVLGLIVPVGALSTWSALLGYPYMAVGPAGVGDFLAAGGTRLPLLNDGDWAVAPAMTLLVLALAIGQLLLAWFLLERDWARVGAVARFGAATLVTLVVVAGLLTLGTIRLLWPVTGLLAEALAVLALARWHDRLPPEAWLDVPDG